MTRTKAVIAFRLCGGSSLEQKEAHDETYEAFDKNEKGVYLPWHASAANLH